MIANNTITLGGRGIESYESSITIANNIVAFNSFGIDNRGGSLSLRNNCVYNPLGSNYSGISPGIGDIQVDPRFADILSGDYHLSADSSCIDAGWDDLVQPDWVDMDGEPRIMGVRVDIGADEYQRSIAEWKAAANGTSVRLRAEIVTAAFDGFFSVEAEDRSAGIRVEKAGHGLQVGDRADVDGVLFTNSDGEKCIIASMVSSSGAGNVEPLAMSIRSLGGGDWRYDPAAGKGQSGVFGGFGLNNIGLLVRCWGKVYSAEGSSFVLDDGSSFADPESNPPYMPVPTRAKVLCPAGVIPPAVGQYVAVTGVSSCEMRPDGKLDRLIRVRTEDDIIPL